jgi:outer membrane lipoprotein SlyB
MFDMRTDKGKDMRIVSLPTATLLASTLIGCATQPPPQQMISSTQGTTLVQTGEVTNVRDVTVSGGRSGGVGSLVGGVLGGIAGSNIGSGYGRTAAAIGGAVAGGAAGQHVERSGGTTRITELTVRFPSGDVRTYNVGQGETYRIGDTVTVTTSQGTTQVTR